MKLFYRISDKSYEKPKLLGATKEVCFMNFCKAFHSVIFDGSNPMTIIADRCERKTVKMLTETGIPVVLTDYGNAGSLFHALKLAKELPDDELVYFCEDDYLHLGKAPKALEEIIKRTEYVTLYDHPDKYTRLYEGGEISKVIKTSMSHWRYTTSTCMTFGTKVSTLKKDFDVWAEYTDGPHPYDHQIFLKLGQVNKRRLIVPIPGLACHVDLTVSNQFHYNLLEPWAIELMIQELENQAVDAIDKKEFDSRPEWHSMKESMTKGKEGMEKLVALDALRQSLIL